MRQPVHKDITFDHPLVSSISHTFLPSSANTHLASQCPFYFIANFPLGDFSPENGSTEFWLGSHAHTTSSDQVPCTEATKVRNQAPGDPSCNVEPEVYEQRRSVRPPIQVVCEKGDVLIRDLRTWHAGMPNESVEDRIMVAIGYQVCRTLSFAFYIEVVG